MAAAPTIPDLATLDDVTRRFGAVNAVDGVSAVIPRGQVTGLVGPDGAGKSTLMRLMAGLLLPDRGKITVDGFDPGTEAASVHERIGYMPQKFGLYEDLTVAENLALYADLHGVEAGAREDKFARLLHFTALEPFTVRLAGRLSGGMKQKLGLACALLSSPRLLLLDEPSVGVDPISRRELWSMVYDLVDQGLGVVLSTAYLDEAERCESVLLMNGGRVLYDGPPSDLTQTVAGHTFAVRDIGGDRRQVRDYAADQPGVIDALIQGDAVRLVMAEGVEPPTFQTVEAGIGASVVPVAPRFEDAFCALLRSGDQVPTPQLPQSAPPLNGDAQAVVEAVALTRRFGDFTAVDNVSFRVRRGEIYGLLGPNGAGKSTTFKMLCGLLPPSAGAARVTGIDLATAGPAARQRIGYMSQKFSLYGMLSVAQNLEFFAGTYGLRGKAKREIIARMVEAFSLQPYLRGNAEALPLGFKQRLALACAIMHGPSILFLDEPTSGVDPLTRREFWAHINAMARAGMTILVTTHFLDEAEYCDRLGLIHAGVLIAEGSPESLKARVRHVGQPEPTMEDAFIHLVESHTEKTEAAS